jgi:hypothetical protein
MTNHRIAIRLLVRQFGWVKRHASVSASTSSLGEIAGVDDQYTLYDLTADRLEQGTMLASMEGGTYSRKWRKRARDDYNVRPYIDHLAELQVARV